MTKLKKINILSFALFQASLAGLIGIAAGILYSFGGAISDLYEFGGWNEGTALAFLALLGMPLVFGAAGFATGILEAILYNLYTKKFKPIDLNFNA